MHICSLIFYQLALLIEFELELELYANCGDFFQVQVFQLATRSTTHRIHTPNVKVKKNLFLS